MSSTQLIIFVILFATILLATIGVSFAGIRRIKNNWNVRKWHKTDGVIVNSRIGIGWSDEFTKNEYPKIEYAYVVGGREYKSTTVDLGMIRRADYVVARYPIGRHVTVFYNPEYIFQATLSQRVPVFATYGLFLLGLCGAFFSGFMLYGFLFLMPK